VCVGDSGLFVSFFGMLKCHSDVYTGHPDPALCGDLEFEDQRCPLAGGSFLSVLIQQSPGVRGSVAPRGR
jgi:hypothetical protein